MPMGCDFGEAPGIYRNFMPNFFYQAMSVQALPIAGGGAETRDWTYVDDIVDGLLAMGIREEAIGEAINPGSGEDHRVVDMASIVNELAGNEAGVVYIERRDWDVKTRLLSSIEKRLLGYEPQTGFGGCAEECARVVCGELGRYKGAGGVLRDDF